MITPIPANIYKRIFAVIFDHLLINSLLLAVYLRFINSKPSSVTLDTNIFLLFLAIIFFYFVFFEGLFGWTIGKKIFKLQVINQKGYRANISSIFLRNLLRPLDFTGLYLLGFIIVTYTQNSQRLGDLLAKTMVVESLD